MNRDVLRKKRYEENDEHRIVQLFEEVYGCPRTTAHWRWKFSGNLLGKAPIRLGEDARGKAVAHYALCPVPVKLGGRIVMGAQSLDTMIAAPFQRKGLMTELARLCYEDARSLGIEIIYGYPNERSYHPLVRKLGFSDLGPVPRFELRTSVVGSLRHAPSLSRLKWIVRSSRCLDRLIHPGSLEHNPDSVRTIEAFDTRQAELCEEIIGERHSVCRSPSYLNWRYRDFPDMRYLSLSTSSPGSGLSGFTVVGVKGAVGFIAELFHTSFDALRNLIAGVARELREVGVGTVTGYFLLEDEEREALKDVGFLERSSDLVFCLKYLGEDPPPNIFSARSWYVSFGDTDGV